MIEEFRDDLLLLERFAVLQPADPKAVAAADRSALKLMGLGRSSELGEALAGIAPAQQTITMRLLGADIAVRAQTATRDEIEVRLAEAEDEFARGGDDLRWWVQAIEAERLFWENDPTAFPAAAVALASVPEGSDVSTAVRVGRGRLRRILAIAMLFTHTGEAAVQGWELMQAAESDLRRAGWEEERALTTGLFATMRTLTSYDDVERSCAALDASVLRLRSLDSRYTALALLGRALVHFVAGNLYTVHSSLDEALERGAALQTGLGPTIGLFAELVRGLTACLPNGPDVETLAALEEISTRVLEMSPERGGGSVALILGMLMADLGNLEWSRHWADMARDSRAFTPYGDVDRRALDARLQILAHADATAVRTIRELVDTDVRLGLRRRGAMVALRAARDCARVGLDDDAVSLQELGLDLLPPPEFRTLWEALLAEGAQPRPTGNHPRA